LRTTGTDASVARPHLLLLGQSDIDADGVVHDFGAG